MKKYPVLIFTVVVLAGGAYYAQQYFIEVSASNPVVVATTTNARPAPTERAAVVAVTTSTTPADTKKIVTVPQVAAETPNVTFVIPSTSYGVYTPLGTTALEAMHILASTTDFEFTGRTYPSLGFFVESLNDTPSENGYVWIFYMNGIKSGKGISSVVVSEGDTIEWKYEKSY